jgi:hypothetical protein
MELLKQHYHIIMQSNIQSHDISYSSHMKLSKLSFFVKKKIQSLSNQMGEQQWYQPKLKLKCDTHDIHLFY